MKKTVLILVGIITAAFGVATAQAQDSLSLGAAGKPTPVNIGFVTEGYDCGHDFQPGDIGMSEDGKILSCQSSRWKGTGFDGTWTNVRGARGNGGTYTNNTGKTIIAAVTDYAYGYGYSSVYAYINGALVASQVGIGDMMNTSNQASLTVPIPSGASYRFTSARGIQHWWEFR